MADQMPKKPWVKYQIGKPSPIPNWVNPDCQQLKRVRHICHLNDALRIVEDGGIRSSLIWDESCLNNTRTLVSWVSPNTWSQSIYGHISFEFEWLPLIEGKHFYWVEVIPWYSPPAYRILITENDYSRCESIGLRLYNPSQGDGPLYFDGESWWWNGDFTAEFMLDVDLSLDYCFKIDFVSHRGDKCKNFGRNCADKSLSNQEIGGIFLANLVGRRITNVNELLIDREKNRFTFSAEGALADFHHGKPSFFKHFNSSVGAKSPSEVESIVRSILLAYGCRNDSLANSLASLIESEEIYQKAIENIIEAHFGLSFEPY
jgi:hypothetical protein